MSNNDHNNHQSGSQKSILTLEHLREYLLECDLSDVERTQLRSAVKRADDLVGQGLLDLPANQRMLFEKLDRLSPAMAGMSEQSYANLKSRLRKAFRLAQGRLLNPRSRFPLTGEWGALQKMLDVKMQRSTSRLFHFAAGLGVVPRHMSDAVIERFEAHLRDEAMIGDWERVVGNSVKAWNRLADSKEDLPALTPPPAKRTSYWIPQAEWSEELLAQLDAFTGWLGSASGYDRKRKKPLKPTTVQQYRHIVAISVSALVHSGVPMSDLATLADVIRPERVDQVLRYLYARTGDQVTPLMFQLALRVRIIARWCDLPQQDLDGLEEIVDDLKGLYEPKRGMTAKNRKLLDRLEDQRFADQVQLLPFILLDRALKNPNKAWAPALVRTAMATEVLLVCSVRRANLIDLELGKSIRKIGHGKDAFWVIERNGVEVKNEEDLRFKLEGSTVELLELYLRDWRPRLCPLPSPWLFPAADGTCLDPKIMAHAVGAQSKRVLGVAITPHQFRHISAALWMKDNPEGIFTISQHLGHRDVNTTRRYYAPPQQRQASRHFQEHILRSRETARIRIKRTNRRKSGNGGFNQGGDLL
ncbi:MAG: site-specific integrase [Sphingomonadales bacterium]|nr:MAG: site-specific integrase [Sphingomonadales bacterium]